MRKHTKYWSPECYLINENERIKIFLFRPNVWKWYLGCLYEFWMGAKKTPWEFITRGFSLTLIWGSTLDYPGHLLLVLLSHFSRVRLCATPSLGFSRQEHWSGLPFPSPMHRSEKWKWSRSAVSDFSRPHGLQSTRLLRPWDFPGKSTGVGCHCFLQPRSSSNTQNKT